MGVGKGSVSFRENDNVCVPAPASQQGTTTRQRCHLLEVGALALVIRISFCYPLSFFISSAAELFHTQEQFAKGIGCACVVKDLGLFVPVHF